MFLQLLRSECWEQFPSQWAPRMSMWPGDGDGEGEGRRWFPEVFLLSASSSRNRQPRFGFHSTAPPLLVRETNTFVRPLESFFTGVVRNRPFWTDLVPGATSSVGRPSCVTIFIDVKRNRPLWTDLVHLGPLFTHETEGPWPNHFRHCHSWKRRSQSKFTSH